MHPISSFYLRFVLVLIFSVSNAFGALRTPAMSGEGMLEDASEVTWAHGVNSRDALEQALKSSANFLEADISLGHVSGKENVLPIPVMAHPPSKTSDISLDDWFDIITTSAANKGLKLDFKSIEVVEPSLIILEKHAPKLNSSVWLNADVLSGPVNSQNIPVQVHQFLAKCHQYFPNATLSLGWTTYWFPGTSQKTWHYEWHHIRNMVDVIKCSGYEGNYPEFTFPVRGIFASRSIKLLQWLLGVIPRSTLTVWSGKYDPLELQDLVNIRSSFPKNKVYYDVPEMILEKFNALKNTISVPYDDVMVEGDQWMTLTRGHGESCSALTYVNNNTVVFGKSWTTAVLRKNLLVFGKDSRIKITGRITFFNSSDELPSASISSPYGMHELMLVLADVSLFTKNVSDSTQKNIDLTSSDTEVIWSALNSSVIFTFQHYYSHKETSCRIFKLDIVADRSFEVWTVPCDMLLEESSFEEISKIGIPEISSRKRLVLPDGPLMLGFVSKGEENVVIHDIAINGIEEILTSSSTPFLSISTGLFISLLCLILTMLMFV